MKRRLVLTVDQELIDRIGKQSLADRRLLKAEVVVLIEEALKVRERKQAKS